MHEDISEKAKYYQRMFFGERYVGASISNILAPDWAQLKILEWMKKPKNFLVYIGNPGVGKTYFCSALMPWALKTFPSFRCYNERNLLTRLRESMDNGGDYLKELKNLIDDPFVIIDDIGSSGLTDWRKDILFEMIDLRYNNMLPTIITSNFTQQEFGENYHYRLMSRLFAKENTIVELEEKYDLRQIGDKKEEKK